MDNLSYNETAALLVANELKLGGQTNPDQILKYAWLFKELREKKFIAPQSRFLLLFISDARQDSRWEDLIEAEVSFCRTISSRFGVNEHTRHCKICRKSERNLGRFNQFQRKLQRKKIASRDKHGGDGVARGFNESLRAKATCRGKSNNEVPRPRARDENVYVEIRRRSSHGRKQRDVNTG